MTEPSSVNASPNVSPNVSAQPSPANVSSSSQSQSPPNLSRSMSRRTHRMTSTRDLTTQRLNAQGSYAKYYKSIIESPLSVKVRCNCGRSREMSWMFLCTFCATGTPKDAFPKDEESKENKEEQQPVKGSLRRNDNNDNINDNELKKDDQDKDKDKDKEDKKNIQRPFLCCDLCAYKMTESYFCPHCLQAYPAHYVKQQTRCPRCVSCPICASPLDKIVYADSNTPTPSKSPVPNANDNNLNLSMEPKEKDKEKEKDSNLSTPTPDVNNGCFLYQCPFCFWSSDVVGLQADVSGKQDLLNNLNSKIQEPYDKAMQDMNKLQEKYEEKNELLRQEQERIHTQTAFHKQYRRRSMLSGKKKSITGPRKPKRKVSDEEKNNEIEEKKEDSLGMSLLTPDDNNYKLNNNNNNNSHRRIPSYLSNPDVAKNEFEKLDRKLFKKQEEWNLLPKINIYNDTDVLDPEFVSQFSLEKYAPLTHKLNNPLTQDTKFKNYLPQRFHLMTKESYKCPNEECSNYVCKPTLRGRVSSFDVRTAVLDYFPKITIHFLEQEQKEQIILNKINQMIANTNPSNINMDEINNLLKEDENNNNYIPKLISLQNTKLLIKFTNRTVQSAKFKINHNINDIDKKFSSCKISCSNDWFEIDAGDIHIKDPKGENQKKETRDNGDYIRGREAGIHVNVQPLYYDNRDVTFSLQIIFETKLIVETDDGKKGNYQDTNLPYILDFNLGPSINPKDAANDKSKNLFHNSNNNNNQDDNDNDNNNDNDETPDISNSNSNPNPQRANKSRNSGEIDFNASEM